LGTERKRTFVSEPLKPVTGSADSSAPPAGAPVLPRAFTWSGGTLGVAAVLRTWRETRLCRHGSGESYVCAHWFEVETAEHGKARIYFERQGRAGGRRQRWWLFSIEVLREEP
jgi:hypothetical protein